MFTRFRSATSRSYPRAVACRVDNTRLWGRNCPLNRTRAYDARLRWTAQTPSLIWNTSGVIFARFFPPAEYKTAVGETVRCRFSVVSPSRKRTDGQTGRAIEEEKKHSNVYGHCACARIMMVGFWTEQQKKKKK